MTKKEFHEHRINKRNKEMLEYTASVGLTHAIQNIESYDGSVIKLLEFYKDIMED